MIAIPSRQIFIPGVRPMAHRKRSWIQRLILLMASAGDTTVDEDGNAILDASGNLFIADGSGTGCPAECAGCASAAPATCTVTIPDGMYDNFGTCLGSSGSSGDRSYGLGGTYTCALTGAGSTTTACSYLYSESSHPFTSRNYTVGCCISGMTVIPDTAPTMQVLVTLGRTAGVPRCTVQQRFILGGGPVNYFIGTTNRAGNCMLPWSVANTMMNSACGGGALQPITSPATVTF